MMRDKYFSPLGEHSFDRRMSSHYSLQLDACLSSLTPSFSASLGILAYTESGVEL